MTDRDEEADALAAALTGMFRQLEARPLPEHIRRVVEQLDAAAAADIGLRRSQARTSSPEP